MKLKVNMVLTRMNEEYVAVPVGADSADFHKILRFNETGADLWKGVQDGLDEKQLVKLLLDNYSGVTQELAESSVRKFLNRLREADLLED